MVVLYTFLQSCNIYSLVKKVFIDCLCLLHEIVNNCLLGFRVNILCVFCLSPLSIKLSHLGILIFLKLLNSLVIPLHLLVMAFLYIAFAVYPFLLLLFKSIYFLLDFINLHIEFIYLLPVLMGSIIIPCSTCGKHYSPGSIIQVHNLLLIKYQGSKVTASLAGISAFFILLMQTCESA